MDPKSRNDLVSVLKSSKGIVERIMVNLASPDWFNLADSDTNIRKYVLNSNRVIHYKKLSTFNLDSFPQMVGDEEMKCLYNAFPEVEKIIVGLSNCKGGILDSLRRFSNLKKVRFYLNSTDFNFSYKKLHVDSLSIKSKFKKSEYDVIYCLLMQMGSISKFSLTEGYLSKDMVEQLEKQKLIKFKLVDTKLEDRLCIPLINTIASNKTLKNLTLISNDFSFNPHPVIIMSELICSLPNIRQLNIEELKFTLDQFCKIKYENLKLLRRLRKLYVYYNVQNDMRNLEILINVIPAMPNIQVTFKEYINPFSSHSRDVDKFLLSFQCKSDLYVKSLENLGENVKVFRLKHFPN